MADRFELVDIVNVEAVCRLAQSESVDVVYSVGSDVAMPTACAVGEVLGLPSFVSSQTARLCNVKSDMRASLGLSFPGNLPFQVVSVPTEEINLSYPLVMKPVDSQGQRGVTMVDSHEAFRSKFAASVVHSRTGRVIVEEWVDGPEISVNTYSVDGRVAFAVVSNRLVWEGFPGGLVRGHRVPVEGLTASAEARVHDLVRRVLTKLEINNGPAYFQIKMAGGSPRLIEVTPRLDGCHMWRLLSLARGVDLLDWTVRHLGGEPPSLHNSNRTTGDSAPLILEFLCQPPNSPFKGLGAVPSGTLFERAYYDAGALVRPMNGFMEKCGYRIVQRPKAA